MSQLNKEMSELRTRYPSELKLKTIETNEIFNDNQREVTRRLRFDYQVAISKRQKLEDEYKSSTEELSSLSNKKQKLESHVGNLQAEMKFIKSLEEKLMSLKLVSATLNSDLIFEDGNQLADQSRTSSPFLIILVSLVIAIVAYSASLVIRYAFDDRIYGEDDLKASFKDLSFVGDVPSFGA